jgi:hypothetical protein
MEQPDTSSVEHTQVPTVVEHPEPDVLISTLRKVIQEWQHCTSQTTWVGFVYRLVIDGKEYVGQTRRSVEYRLLEHMTRPCGKLVKLLKDRSRNEIDASILHTVEATNYQELVSKLHKAEHKEIRDRDCVKSGWNSNQGKSPSEDTINSTSFPLGCEDCCRRFQSGLEYVTHRYLAHNIGESPFRCALCRTSHEDALSLFDHNIQEHFQKPKCGMCRRIVDPR